MKESSDDQVATWSDSGNPFQEAVDAHKLSVHRPQGDTETLLGHSSD